MPEKSKTKTNQNKTGIAKLVDPSSIVGKKDLELSNAKDIGYIAGLSAGNLSGKKASKGVKSDLDSKSEKEQEIEDLLSEEEKLEENYKRIEKQGMSDQGIVSPEQLAELGKDVYKGAKKVGKKVVGKVKEVVEKVKEKIK